MCSVPRVLSLLTFVLLVAACGGGDKKSLSALITPAATVAAPQSIATSSTPTSGATPAATASTSPSPVPGTPVATRRVAVRWVDAPSPLDLGGATESATPWAELLSAVRQRNPNAGPDEWRVYSVGGDGNAKQLYSSRRELADLSWGKDGMIATVTTIRSVYSQPLGKAVQLGWRGRLNLNSATGAGVEKLDAMTSLQVGPSLNLRLFPRPREIALETAPVAGLMLATLPQTGAPASTNSPAFLVDASGKARHLEDVPVFSALYLVPSGKAVVGQTMGFAGDVYLMPVASGDAQVVSGVRGLAIEAVWVGDTATGNRVFLFVQSSSGVCCDYDVFDADTGIMRTVGNGPFVARNPAVDWTRPDKVYTGDELIDVNTGKRETVGSLAPRDVSSPSGRYVLRVADPLSLSPTQECAGKLLSVSLQDTQTKTDKTLMQCQGGAPATARWLDDKYALLTSEGETSQLSLLDAEAGTLRPLTTGPSGRVFAALSPDGARVLVSGDKLQLLNATTGAMMREFEAPSGFRFVSAAWSVDGGSFAYILGPSDWPRLGEP